MSESAAEKSIRRVIRRRGTADYFKGDGWTQDHTQAWQFSDSVEAAQTCAQHGLIDVELALLMGGRQPHVVFSTAIR